jgi:hypothetical protein
MGVIVVIVVGGGIRAATRGARVGVPQPRELDADGVVTRRTDDRWHVHGEGHVPPLRSFWPHEAIRPPRTTSSRSFAVHWSLLETY